MLGSVPDAEDALQDALLRAWRGLPALRGPQLAAQLALPDRDERLPERRSSGGPPRLLPMRLRAGLRSVGHRRGAARRADLDRARTRTTELGVGRRLCRACCALRAAREPRARVHRRTAAAPGAAARDADHARGARLLGARGGRVARHERRSRQQLAAARAQGDRRADCPSRASRRRCARSASTEHPRARAALHGRDGAGRRRRRRRDADRGRDVVDAAVRELVQRPRRHHRVPARARAQGSELAPRGDARQRPGGGRLLHAERGRHALRAARDRRADASRRPHRRRHGVRDSRRLPALRPAGVAAAACRREAP